jgi:hypothetical protein
MTCAPALPAFTLSAVPSFRWAVAEPSIVSSHPPLACRSKTRLFDPRSPSPELRSVGPRHFLSRLPR